MIRDSYGFSTHDLGVAYDSKKKKRRQAFASILHMPNQHEGMLAKPNLDAQLQNAPSL